MGHELHIHRDFYRLHESTVEIAKVSRILIAVDSGEARKYKGKSLNEIAIEDISFESAQVGSNEEVDMNEGTANSEVESCHSESENEKSVSLKRKRAPLLSSSSDEENFVQAKNSKPQQSLKRKWTTAELVTLKSVFHTFSQDKVYPLTNVISKAISENECLKHRSTAQIRSSFNEMLPSYQMKRESKTDRQVSLCVEGEYFSHVSYYVSVNLNAVVNPSQIFLVFNKVYFILFAIL